MKITSLTSHVLRYDLDCESDRSQGWCGKRMAHLVEVRTNEGVTGWGECFGPGDISRANHVLLTDVIAPLAVNRNPLAREALWHEVDNAMRDHGLRGAHLQALSGFDMALWDIAGKTFGQPLSTLLGGLCRDRVAVYGCGMTLRSEPADCLAARFSDEVAAIRAAGFRAAKMHVGVGAAADLKLVEAVRRGAGAEFQIMVDANHCYATPEAMAVGRGIADLGVCWFEEPLPSEDLEGYAELRESLDVNIAGGGGELARWGWRRLLEGRCLDIAQPEVCAIGGISEYLRVLALAQAHFTPVVNRVRGSGLVVAANIHLLAAMPPMSGSLCPWEPMLEFDTAPDLFRDEMLADRPDWTSQIATSGSVAAPAGPGLGVEPDRAFLKRFAA